jgi:CelD/BcsL family acetyltransferase involved in cellulose biosynthesis
MNDRLPVNDGPLMAADVGHGRRGEKCSTTVIETERELDGLENTWNEILSESDSTVFQTFEWQRTWWMYFGKGRRLHCFVFNFNGRTVGIAPMFKEPIRVLGLKIATHLQFIGSPLSDYVDIIIRPGYEVAVLEALTECLVSSAKEWDVFDIEDVSERSVIMRVLPKILEKHGVPVFTYQGNVCPQLTLPATWELFLQGLGPNGRYNFRRKSKKLQERFETEVEILENETDDLVAGVDAFVRLHGERWRSLGYPSAFDDGTHRAFHIEIAKRFARRGWLRLFFLKVNGVRVAVSFDFNYANRIYMYQANAHAPEEIMRYSPGFLINCIAIRRAITEGMKVFDFLRGDEAYKLVGMKARPSKNWLLRTAYPSKTARVRFWMFLVYELFKKSGARMRKEYYGLKRFNRTGKPSARLLVRYLFNRSRGLAQLVQDYFVRHIFGSSSSRARRHEDAIANQR